MSGLPGLAPVVDVSLVGVAVVRGQEVGLAGRLAEHGRRRPGEDGPPAEDRGTRRARGAPGPGRGGEVEGPLVDLVGERGAVGGAAPLEGREPGADARGGRRHGRGGTGGARGRGQARVHEARRVRGRVQGQRGPDEGTRRVPPGRGHQEFRVPGDLADLAVPAEDVADAVGRGRPRRGRVDVLVPGGAPVADVARGQLGQRLGLVVVVAERLLRALRGTLRLVGHFPEGHVITGESSRLAHHRRPLQEVAGEKRDSHFPANGR